ncbi:hypothetical protein F2P81_017287 [Scophthalmus maximus]|uniref:Uncharacterized protein n=1 Tax=Scophthalmus maximus TaxID=52904 RepID=A0A6A4S5R6_SCOMX|nr:hypothetical protein F2P81_017287 [Scophthalmus maximus]
MEERTDGQTDRRGRRRKGCEGKVEESEGGGGRGGRRGGGYNNERRRSVTFAAVSTRCSNIYDATLLIIVSL